MKRRVRYVWQVGCWYDERKREAFMFCRGYGRPHWRVIRFNDGASVS